MPSCAAFLVSLMLAVASSGGPSGSGLAASPSSDDPSHAFASTYQAPVSGRLAVVNSFDAVAGDYGAGHRGVDLALPVGAPVLAAGAGVVRFAGSVAGRALVVLSHPDGVSTEYEPLTLVVQTGRQVARGQVIGTLAGSHRGCANSCLHWGAQRAGEYFDPLNLLRPLGVVRLVPCHARGWACS